MSRTQPAAGPARPGAGGASVAAVVGFLVFVELVSGITQGMLPTLLPHLGAVLDISAGKLGWVSTAQLLAAAISVPIFSRLGDMYGHRKLLRIAVLCLALGSILVACAPNFGLLLVGRILQGPLAALLPLEIGLVRDRLNPEGARSAIGLLIGALTFGASAGMVVAGLLSKTISNVHGILWVPAIAVVLCAGVVFFLVPESTTRARGSVDWAGAGLLSVGLGALLLAIAQGPDWGWTASSTLAFFALGLIAMAVWVLVELRVPAPLIDIRLTVSRGLAPVYTASFTLGAALFGSQTAALLFFSSPPEKLGYGFGYDALGIAWMMLPSSALAFAGSTLAPRLTRAIGGRTVLTLSGMAMTVGYVIMVFAHAEPWQVVLANCVIGLGNGLALSALPALVLDTAPAERTAIATGVFNSSKTLGGSVGGAVFAAVLTAITFQGTEVPKESAYTTVWWCCAGVSILVTAASLILVKPKTASGSGTPTAPAASVSVS